MVQFLKMVFVTLFVFQVGACKGHKTSGQKKDNSAQIPLPTGSPTRKETTEAKKFSPTDSLAPPELQGVWNSTNNLNIPTPLGNLVFTGVLEIKDGLMINKSTCNLGEGRKVTSESSAPTNFVDDTVLVLEDNFALTVDGQVDCEAKTKKGIWKFEVSGSELTLTNTENGEQTTYQR